MVKSDMQKKHCRQVFPWSGSKPEKHYGIYTAMAALLVLFSVQPHQSAALELSSGESGITGYFDTTVSIGAAKRTQGRKSKLVAASNGGSAWSINEDDGNLNYDPGDLISANVKVTHELELNRQNLGLFLRTSYFYDSAIADDSTERIPLSKSAKKHAGYDINLLDAYVTGDFDLGGAPLSVRLGDQVINWGESIFIRNGLNSINPVDSSKVRGRRCGSARCAGTGHGGQYQARRHGQPVPGKFLPASLDPHRTRTGGYIFLDQRHCKPRRRHCAFRIRRAGKR